MIVSSQETQFIDDIAYVNTSYGMIAQQPFIIDSNTEANIMFENRAGISSFIACIRLGDGLSIDTVEIVSAKRKVWWWFDEDLREVHRINDKIKCIKSFENENYIDLSLKLKYNGQGMIKYDLFAYPASYGYTMSGILDAMDAGHIIILDPYLIGNLSNNNELYLRFDGNLSHVFNETYNIWNLTGDSTAYTGSCRWPLNATDGNWSSYGDGTPTCNFFYNFTKYPNSYGAIWEIKYHSAPGRVNFTVPIDCFNAYSDKLVFRTIADNGAQDSNWSCYNSTDWILLKHDNAHDDVYENGVHWIVSNRTESDNATYRIDDDNATLGYEFKFKGDSSDVFGSNDGTDINITYTSDGAEFNGVDSNISFSQITLNTTVEATVTFWVQNLGKQNHAVLAHSSTIKNHIIFTDNGSTLYYEGDDNGEGCYANEQMTNDSLWHHYAIVWDDVDCIMYEDGINVSTTLFGVQDNNATFSRIGDAGGIELFNGTVEEIYIYNRALSDNEILNQYNDGNYTPDKQNVTNHSIYFKGNDYVITDTIQPVQNMTISAWIKSDNTALQYIAGEGDTGNNGYFLSTNSGNSIRFKMGSGSASKQLLSDGAVDFSDWTHVAGTYDGTTMKLWINGILNSTDTGTVSGPLAYSGITEGFVVGQIEGYTLARTFNGSIDEVMIFNRVLSDGEIFILADGFDVDLNNCSIGGEQIFTINLNDETSLDQVNTSQGEIEYSFASYDPIANKSSQTNNLVYSNTVTICSASADYDKLIINATIKYNTSNGVIEYYYLRNLNLSGLSIPQEIELYGLAESLSTSFLITYQDENYLYIPDVVIDLQRKYVGEGNLFYSVEHGLTDDGGQTRLHLVTEDIVYRFIVRSSNNSILYTSGEYFALCQATPCQINIQKPSDETEEESITGNLQYSITNDSVFEATGIIAFEFLTTDSSITNMSMNVTNTGENESLCFNFSSGSTGSMSCFIPPAFDNNTYLAKIFKDEDYIGVKSYSTQPRAQDLFGDIAIFMGTLGYVMLAFIGVSNPIASIVLGIIGLVFMSTMLILDGGSAFGIGSAFIWLFVAGGILIWKIYQRRA